MVCSAIHNRSQRASFEFKRLASPQSTNPSISWLYRIPDDVMNIKVILFHREAKMNLFKAKIHKVERTIGITCRIQARSLLILNTGARANLIS